MKKITEMSDKEILNLSEKDLETLIKREKAEKGIKLLEYPKTPEYHKIPVPTNKVYVCPLFDTDIVFEEEKDLEEVLNLIQGRACYSINAVNNLTEYKFLNPELKNRSWRSEPYDKVEIQKVYTETEIKKLTPKLKENKKLKNEHDLLIKEYETIKKESQEISNTIYDIYENMHNKYYEMERMKNKFNDEYLPLAEGNKEMAMGFLQKVYSIGTETEKYILKKEKK